MASKRALNADNFCEMNEATDRGVVPNSNADNKEKDKENILKLQHEIAMLRIEVPEHYKKLLNKERLIHHEQLKMVNCEIMDKLKWKITDKPSVVIDNANIKRKFEDIMQKRSSLNELSENVFQCWKMINDDKC